MTWDKRLRNGKDLTLLGGSSHRSSPNAMVGMGLQPAMVINGWDVSIQYAHNDCTTNSEVSEL